MQISSKAYMDEFKPKQQMKIINKIHHASKLRKVYVAVFPLTEDGLFEIYEYNELLKPYYKKQQEDVLVIAIGKSKEAVQNLVINMIQDAYMNGEVSKEYFREYFKN